MSTSTRLSGFSLFSVLSIAFVWLFEASAIAPALGAIAQRFPDASELQIKNVMTVPFVTSIIFSVLCGSLASRYDKKWIAVVGLAIYGVTGVLPAYATSIEQVLFLRLLTGVGVGLVLPITNMYISEHFEGVRRERMLGLALAVANSANVINSLVIGVLQALSWRYPFFAFSIVVPIMAMVVLAVPSSRGVAKKAEKGAFRALPAGVYFNAACMTFLWILFAVDVINVALFMEAEHIGAPWMIGLGASSPAIGSMVAGALFPELKQTLRSLLVPVGLAIFAIGFACLYAAHSVSLVVVGSLLIGVGQGAVVAYLFETTAKKVTSDSQKDAAFGIVNGCIHVGMLISPFAQLAFLQSASSWALAQNEHFRALFLASAVIILVVGLSSGILGVRNRVRAARAAS